MKNCSVLIVEDELLIGMDLVSTLQRAGFHHVEHAATEQEALVMLQQKSWDLVVADANLNGKSVEQVVTTLRERGLPFVIVTGYGRESLPEIVGDAPVLNKPYSHLQFVRIVQELCSATPENLSSPEIS